MLTKKYEITDETKALGSKTLHRIKALTNIGQNIKKGDVGGWIEKESNLSQRNNAWVYGNAMVYDGAMVYGDAWICGNAEVFNNAEVFGNAIVRSCAIVCGNAEVSGNAKVYDDARIYGNAKVFGDAKVCCNARIYGNVEVYDNAQICGDTQISGEAQVCCNAQLLERTDVLTIGPIGSRDDTTTFYKAQDNKIFVKCGCKNTDIDTWLDMVKETHGDNKHAKTYRLAAQIARLQILGEEV